MSKEKGIRRTREPDQMIEHRLKGEIDLLMESKEPIDMDKIFDDENAHQLILVEVRVKQALSTITVKNGQKVGLKGLSW